jgi:hypothetical protein
VTPRITRRGPLAIAALAAAAAAAVLVAFALPTHPPAHPPAQTFPALVPAAAPASWPQATLPDRTAVLSYPPGLRPIHGDRGTVSAARLGPHGSYLLYLNATPRQGAENLQNWAAFRQRLLRADEAASAHLDAAAERLKFRGGTGSCVIDDYITKIGGHHYEEIACLVQGRSGASVIVGAAPAAQWIQAGPLLERAVAAYLVR